MSDDTRLHIVVPQNIVEVLKTVICRDAKLPGFENDLAWVLISTQFLLCPVRTKADPLPFLVLDEVKIAHSPIRVS